MRSATRTSLSSAALLLAFATIASAQMIHGRVVDAVTRTSIPLASVSLLDNTGRVITSQIADTAGEFAMPTPRDDSIALKIEVVGFATLQTRRFAIGRGQLLDVEVRMSASALPLEPMVVVARQAAPLRLQEFYRRADWVRKSGQGRVWMREDLERENLHSVRGLLGLMIVRPGGGCTGSKILLDDLPVDSHDLDLIAVSDLEGIEIYHDAMEVPQQYAPLCSLVLMWRKPYGENGRPLTWRRVLFAVGAGLLLFILVRH